METLVGVVTNVTSAITGAVVSVVVVVSSEESSTRSSLMLHEDMTVRLKRNMEIMMSICLI